MRIGNLRRTVLTVALTAASTMGTTAAQAQGTTLPASWLQLIGLLPAPTYDPYASQIPRRRPGHPPEPLPMFVEQNPDALNPAPVDQAAASCRCRIAGASWNRWAATRRGTTRTTRTSSRATSRSSARTGSSRSPAFPTPCSNRAASRRRSVRSPVPSPARTTCSATPTRSSWPRPRSRASCYYKGDTAFKPPEYRIQGDAGLQLQPRATPRRCARCNVDPTFGTSRDDGFIGVQELFVTKDYRTASARYDVDEVRIGIQPFSSDFRGFLFQDNQPGVRFFGNRDNNRWQYNFAWFRRLEKDINSGLNDVTKGPRKDDIFLANLYRQDFPVVGFVSQAIFAYNRNREDSSFYDSNGFIQRPAAIGREFPRTYDVGYFGYNGDGHFGRLNLTVAGLRRGRQAEARRVRRRGRPISAPASSPPKPRWISTGSACAARSPMPAATTIRTTTARPATTRSSRTRFSPVPTRATGSARTCR